MVKNRKKFRQNSRIQSLPQFSRRSAATVNVTNTAGNAYYGKITDVKAFVSGYATDGYVPVVRKFLYKTGYNWSIEPAMTEFYIVVANNGAAFTDGNVSEDTNIGTALDGRLDKPFSFEKVGEMSSKKPVLLNVAAPWFEGKVKDIDITKYAKKLAGMIEDPKYLSTTTPEVFLVCVTRGFTTGNHKMGFQIEQQYDLRGRKINTRDLLI